VGCTAEHGCNHIDNEVAASRSCMPDLPKSKQATKTNNLHSCTAAPCPSTEACFIDLVDIRRPWLVWPGTSDVFIQTGSCACGSGSTGTQTQQHVSVSAMTCGRPATSMRCGQQVTCSITYHTHLEITQDSISLTVPSPAGAVNHEAAPTQHSTMCQLQPSRSHSFASRIHATAIEPTSR
jgi:hypothetical protein